MSWICQIVYRKGKTEEKYVWWFVDLPTRFDFIHDKNERRIIEACSILHHKTIPQRLGFLKISPSTKNNNIKIIKNLRYR